MLVATGAAIGGGLALVGVMAAAGRNAESDSTSTPTESTETGTTDQASSEQDRVVRRVVIPVSPSDGAPSAPTSSADSNSAGPVTRSNGS